MGQCVASRPRIRAFTNACSTFRPNQTQIICIQRVLPGSTGRFICRPHAYQKKSTSSYCFNSHHKDYHNGVLQVLTEVSTSNWPGIYRFNNTHYLFLKSVSIPSSLRTHKEAMTSRFDRIVSSRLFSLYIIILPTPVSLIIPIFKADSPILFFTRSPRTLSQWFQSGVGLYFE